MHHLKITCFVIYYLWMHVIYYLGCHGSMTKVPFIMKQPTLAPLRLKAATTT